MPQISFAADIKPLFRTIDISHMTPFGVELDDYTYMSNPDNANSVYSTLAPHGKSHHPCRPADPIGRRPNSRCSSNGRRMDTSHRSWSTGNGCPILRKA